MFPRLFHVFFKKQQTSLRLTQRILLDLCHPVADLPKSLNERGDKDRATDTTFVMESGTQWQAISMCIRVRSPKGRETQMRSRQVNHKPQNSRSLSERKLVKEKIHKVNQYVVI